MQKFRDLIATAHHVIAVVAAIVGAVIWTVRMLS